MNIERKLKWYFWRRLCFPKHLSLMETKTWVIPPVNGLKMSFQIGQREFATKLPSGFREDKLFAAFYRSYKRAQRRVKEENMTFIVRGKHIIKKETGEVVGFAKSEKAAHISASIRNRASSGEKKSRLKKFKESFKKKGD